MWAMTSFHTHYGHRKETEMKSCLHGKELSDSGHFQQIKMHDKSLYLQN